MQEGLPGRQAVSESSTPYVSAPSTPGRAEGHHSNSNSTSSFTSDFEFEFEFSARYSALEEVPMSPMPMHASSREPLTYPHNPPPSNSTMSTPNNTKIAQSFSPLISFFHQHNNNNNNHHNNNNNNNSPPQPISPLSKVASSLKDIFYPRKNSPSQSLNNPFPRHQLSHSISRNNNNNNNKRSTPIKKSSSPIMHGKQSLARSSSTSYPHSNSLLSSSSASLASSSSISLHYAAQRAHAEEMKKKTYLPYRQGILGCLGFQSRSCNVKSASCSLSRTIKHIS